MDLSALNISFNVWLSNAAFVDGPWSTLNINAGTRFDGHADYSADANRRLNGLFSNNTLESRRPHSAQGTDLTDAPSGRELVEKAFVYMTNLSKECRKAIASKFEQEHKGIPFESAEPTMRKELEAWFAERDRNISVRHEKSDRGRPGEILMTYSGTSKEAHFKFRVDAQFTLAGSSDKASAYLKAINVNVDKRDFTK